MTARAKWHLIWAVWFLIILLATAGTFVALEAMSWTGGVTLSRSVYDLTSAFPLAIWFAGVFVGSLTTGLAVHFWWHWSPPGSGSEG
jgi:hypothetical protein